MARRVVSFALLGSLLLVAACTAEVDPGPRLGEGESPLSLAQRMERYKGIRTAVNAAGLQGKGYLWAGISMAETGLAHCWSEATWACKGPGSPDCGGAPVIAGSADGPCADQQGGLGMWQFDAGTYAQTLAAYGDKVLTVVGSTGLAVDFMVERVRISKYTSNAETTAKARQWIADFDINNATLRDQWISTVTNYYNGCPKNGSCWPQRYKHYNDSLSQVLSETGLDFWIDTVDWKATYVAQSFPLASEPFVLAPGETKAGYIELRNEGKQTWKPGEVFLGTTQPKDGPSALAGPGWVSPTRAATVDKAVAPGATGRFNFTVKAPATKGDHAQFFNLLREGVHWFSDAGQGGPKDDQLQVKVTVVPKPCPAGLGPTFTCDGDTRKKCDPATGVVTQEACPNGCANGTCNASGAGGSAGGSGKAGAGGKAGAAGGGGASAGGGSGGGKLAAGAAGAAGQAGMGGGEETVTFELDDSETEGGSCSVGAPSRGGLAFAVGLLLVALGARRRPEVWSRRGRALPSIAPLRVDVSTRPKSMRWTPLVTGSLALAAAGVVGAAALVELGVVRLPGPRVTVDGREPPRRRGDLGAWLDGIRARRALDPLAVGADGDWVIAEQGALGVELDVAATQARVAAVLDAPVWERVARRHERIDVPLSFRVDVEKAKTTLAALAPKLHRAPVSAKLDLQNRLRIADVPGRELDVEATTESLRDAARAGETTADARLHPIRAGVTLDDLAKVEVEKVLSSFETTFTTWGTGAGRAVNIANAARRLDGLVLQPGESLSFNEVVGERSLERGFTYAPEIVGDELEMGVGGGTCQVASTLHAAAVFGALDVVDRRSHGRPSSYTKLGLDATVAWGKVDLKLRNPFPFPVLLHAYLPKPTVVRVEVLGGEPQAKVEYKYAINRSDDFFRRITLKPFLPKGTIVRHQKGNRGFAVVSFVTTTYADGRVLERSYFSEYRPVPEVLWVGPGFDEEALPELPDGAKRVERRGLPKPDSALETTSG